MRVLITDGNERASLAVVRALGREGVEVVVGADTPGSLAAQSRYCTRQFLYPSPYRHPEAFLAALLSEVRYSRPDAIYPIAEISMEVIGRHQQEFGGPSVVPIPSIDIFSTMSDKFRLMQLAQQLSVPIPDTVFVKEGKLEDVETHIKEYPVVVKPARSLVQSGERWYKTSVHVVKDRDALAELYRHTDYLKEPSLIQRRIVGEGQGVFALMDHGRPAAVFAHRRLRERPPSGGVSVLRESIPLPQPMTDYALRLLQHVGWHGVAMVEFKVDQKGTPYLMEINGRFWGSLQLAIDAGINFPYLLLLMAKSRLPAAPCPSYRIGVRSRWLLGDLDHLLLRLFKAEEKGRLPPGAPSAWTTLVNFFLPQKGKITYYETERRDDLGPAWAEYRGYVRGLVKRGKA